jgi:hypothetical protein
VRKQTHQRNSQFAAPRRRDAHTININSSALLIREFVARVQQGQGWLQRSAAVKSRRARREYFGLCTLDAIEDLKISQLKF